MHNRDTPHHADRGGTAVYDTRPIQPKVGAAVVTGSAAGVVDLLRSVLGPVRIPCRLGAVEDLNNRWVQRTLCSVLTVTSIDC